MENPVVNTNEKNKNEKELMQNRISRHLLLTRTATLKKISKMFEAFHGDEINEFAQERLTFLRAAQERGKKKND